MTTVTSGKAGAKKPRKSNELPASIFSVVPITEKLLMESAPALETDMIELRQQLKLVEDKEDPVALARAFVALHRLREFINTILGENSSIMSKVFNYYKAEAIDAAFAKAQMPHVPLDEGFRVGLTKSVQVSIPADKKADAFQWLRDNNLGDIIKPTVHAGTLSATVQVMMEEQNVEPPSELFTIHTARHASVTALKGNTK